MPKITPSAELDRLHQLITRHPEGLGVDKILQLMGEPMQRRTLQRRLALLVAQGRIRTRGEARATRYLPASALVEHASRPLQVREEAPQPYVPNAPNAPSAEPYVLTSPEGDEIKAYVRQPRQLRRPVSYQVEFLEAYHPNQTAYLPTALREQLHTLGRSPADQTPAGTFARDILNRLLIDFSWASSQFEGNTYSRLDTARLI